MPYTKRGRQSALAKRRRAGSKPQQKTGFVVIRGKKYDLREYTKAGKKRLTTAQRSRISKRMWKGLFASGDARPAQPRPKLSAEERSEAAKGAWETRKRNEAAAQRRQKRLRKRRAQARAEAQAEAERLAAAKARARKAAGQKAAATRAARAKAAAVTKAERKTPRKRAAPTKDAVREMPVAMSQADDAEAGMSHAYGSGNTAMLA